MLTKFIEEPFLDNDKKGEKNVILCLFLLQKGGDEMALPVGGEGVLFSEQNIYSP